MSIQDGDEQIYDLAPLSPSADLDEIREHLIRLHQWRRAREPVAEGDILAKYCTNGALVARGLLTISKGISGAGGDGWTPNATGGGTDGLNGVSAQLLDLNSTSFYFSFDGSTATTSADPAIVFTAALQNISGTVTFTGTAYDAAGSVVGTIGDVTFTSVGAATATLTSANFTRGGAVVRRVVVTATLGSLSDTITVFRGDNGSDSVQVRLTNEAHTIAAESDGAVIAYTGASGTMEAYKGLTQLTNVTTPSVAYSIVGFTGFTSAYSTPGTSFFSGKLTINATTGAYQVSGNIDDAAPSATVTFRATLSTGATFDSIFSISKSLTGDNGLSIKIKTDNGAAFVSATSGTTYTPSSITLRRDLLGGLTSGDVTTVWTTIGTGTLTGSLATITESDGRFASIDPTEMTADTVTIKCTVTQISTGNTFIDQLTLFKSRDGFGAYLTNDSINLDASSAGVISSYTGATGTFKVVNAAGDVGTGSISFSIVGHSGFVASFPTIPAGMTITSGGVYTVSASAPIATASLIAYVDYQASYTDPLTGTSRLFTRRFTIGKAKAGTDGTDGGDGTDGTRGSLTLYSASVSPAIYLSGSTWPDDATSPFGTNDNNASKIVWIALGNSSGSFVSNSIGHLRIGDTVTLTNSGGTLSIVKFYAGVGSGWLAPGTVISGNLLVGGTISGGVNLAITGSATFEGFNSISVPDPTTLISSSMTVALLANTSYTANIGVGGMASSSTKAGVYGYNANGSGGSGTFGFGFYGVKGYSSASTGAGVYGQAHSSGASQGVLGTAQEGVSTSIGVKASNVPVGASGPFGTLGTALLADGSNGGLALKVLGLSTFDSQITSTKATGTAPFAVTSKTMCSNLNAEFLQGKPLSTSGAWWGSGGTVPLISSGGVMEGPKFIDFHLTNTETTDYLARLEVNNGSGVGTGELFLTQKNNVKYQVMAGINQAAGATALTTANVPTGATPTLKWLKVPIASEAGGYGYFAYVV